MDSRRILVVDDDEAIRKLIRDVLAAHSFPVNTVGSAPDALSALRRASYEVVLSDVRMPGMSGLELIHEIRRDFPDVSIVMLSGCDDVRLAVQAMRDGASDYIVKPFHVQEVLDTIGKVLDERRQREAHQQHITDLETALARQSAQVSRMLEDLNVASETTLEALVAALDAREHETKAHSRRVSEYSVHLASLMGVQGEDLEIIRRGSMIHDIGKIGISDNILLKPGRLDEDEWKEMRRHPEIGYLIVRGIESLRPASEIVLSHHERYDGSGYPRNLAADDIPLGARVFSVVDTFDAIVSDRPYHLGRSYTEARDEISRNSGRQFDPKVVDSFLRVPNEVWSAIRVRTIDETSSTPIQFTQTLHAV